MIANQKRVRAHEVDLSLAEKAVCGLLSCAVALDCRLRTAPSWG